MTTWQGDSISSTDVGENPPGWLHAWPHSLVRWLFGRGEEEHVPAASAGTVARFQNICISREAGAGAEDIARLVGQKLGWKVYDHELIEAIAHRMGVSLDEVRVLDELAPSVVQDWLLPLREEYYAPQEAYLDHLAKLIEAIGRAGESILVGRGAGYMLPRDSTLSVRVIAPLKVRAPRLAERMGVSVRTARRAARDIDRRRIQFDRTMHRANSNDPHNFDIVLDSNSLGLEIAAEAIAHAVVAGRPRGMAIGPLLRGAADRGTAKSESLLPAPDDRSVSREPSATPALPSPPPSLASEPKPDEKALDR
ncbi:MAG: AAA family ATPase [Isosphaeraceae bacterium]